MRGPLPTSRGSAARRRVRLRGNSVLSPGAGGRSIGAARNEARAAARLARVWSVPLLRRRLRNVRRADADPEPGPGIVHLVHAYLERLPAVIGCLVYFLAFDFFAYWLHRLLHHRWLWSTDASPLQLPPPQLARGKPHNLGFATIFERQRGDPGLDVGAGRRSVCPAAPSSDGLAYNSFIHSNIKIKSRLLNAIFVTGERFVHHAKDLRAGNSNFAFLFSFWDRLFGTWLESRAPCPRTSSWVSAMRFQTRRRCSVCRRRPPRRARRSRSSRVTRPLRSEPDRPHTHPSGIPLSHWLLGRRRRTASGFQEASSGFQEAPSGFQEAPSGPSNQGGS